MRFLPFFMLILSLAGTVLSVPSQAQERVAVRSGTHDGYTRLVFEWPSPPQYSVSKESGRVLIRFAKAGTLDKAGISADEPNVKSVDILSAATEPLQVAVAIPTGSKFRDFVVGSKMILDVYDPDVNQAAKSPAEPKESAKPAPYVVPAQKKAEAETPLNQKEKPVEPKAKGDFTISQGESAASAPIHGVEATKVASPEYGPHVVTLTTVTSVGLAVFERNGSLWIVADVPDLAVAPQIAGPQKEKFSRFDKIDLPNGIAWRLELPDGLHPRGEGGGLSWKIVLDKGQANAEPVSPSVSEASLIWPLKNMRKVLTLQDPVVGDTITAVTANAADQFAGPARRFVQLQTLPSAVGLAFVPKSDDVSAKVGPNDVTVGRPQGLSLSDAKDVQPGKIHKAMNEGEATPPAAEAPLQAEIKLAEPSAEKPAEHSETEPAEEPKASEHTEDAGAEHAEEAKAQELEHQIDDKAVSVSASKEELAKAVSEKPEGNNIFNFAKWELGGIHALEGNLHVLMVEVSNKPEDQRAGDFITMAKLLLANNRGPEALGMLRIALQKVPDLEDNQEFQALRGAALAQSNMYDEAIEDFDHEALSGYDDIRLWRAYTLAGLEDWKQAGEVLPPDLSTLEKYPHQIRTPMALSFAEVFLRNGKIAQAQQMLDMLRPEIAHLPLNQASAWNYLAGEAARQAGEPTHAAEYWEPLVKNGKDDLYRAKAGLSLTKLQIDEKKLSPEQAINRLEGLRYAWRGDELETLINYRLGKLYIDNKDYLKGLTVLRNATTLTPGLQVGQDVKDYMTRSFRDLFMNNKLETVSPLEAISIYEEFKDLTPPGAQGDAFVEKLADRLVKADLLGRASSLLDYMVTNRLQGNKKVETAIKLAAIRLLDGNPDGALRSLEVAQDTYNKVSGVVPAAAPPPPAADAAKMPEDVAPQAGEATPAATAQAAPATAEKPDPEMQRQIYLLKARALSMKKKPDEAIAILEGMPLDADVNKLRTDIAWTSGKWEEAAMSLNDLIIAEDISPKRPLTDYQRDIILNRGIALNLSGNRVALANLRERFNPQMKSTTKGQVFEIVTRPRRPDMVGSREAIESMISEIDLFKGFLDGYAKMDTPDKPVAAPSSAASAAPAQEGAKAAPVEKPSE